MIEAKNLKKIYKPKKGTPVTALDDVSLKLPSKGMVFILGKSGSGKSTLLNVLGGLDSFDSGEILINGETTQNFKQVHYDSYRNTYIGFIFQEYNVLEEFTVGANIALAIELQGRKATNEEINAILSEVDLVGYGNRKPNELSGGQKQRVAIARALVKKPEIIMADEPTGALDSATGKQVFDTLKKLSTDKLVLIVSHDRDFSENYADRIIELADGKIIDDVEIDNSTERKVEETNIEYKYDEILVSPEYELTEEDRIEINNYLKNLNKKVKIRPKANKNVFVKTDENKIIQDKQGFKLIKSKLPLKAAFKIGSSGLKHKKFRLVMTIFLSFISFTLFGLADTIASYNNVKTCTNSLMDSQVDYASFTKNSYSNEDGVYEYEICCRGLSNNDLDFIAKESGVKVKGVYNKNLTLNIANNLFFDDIDYDELYGLERLYSNYLSGFAEITSNDLQEYGYTLLAGKLPDGTKDEIAISKYTFDFFKATGYRDGVTQGVKITNYSDIIGKTLELSSGFEYTVTGVIDTKFNYDRYNMLLKSDNFENPADMILFYALSEELNYAKNYSLNCVAFVGNGFIAKIDEQCKSSVQQFEIGNADFYLDDSWFYQYVQAGAKLSDFEGNIYWLNDGTTKLEKNQVIVSKDIYSSIVKGLGDYIGSDETIPSSELAKYSKKVTVNSVEINSLNSVEDVLYTQAYYDLAMFSSFNYAIERYQENHDNFIKLCKDVGSYNDSLSDEDQIQALASLLQTNLVNNIYSDFPVNETVDGIVRELIGCHLKLINNIYTDYGHLFDKLKLEYYQYGSGSNGNLYVEIVGICDDYKSITMSENCIMICNDEIIEKLVVDDKDAIYGYAVGSMPADKNDVTKLVKFNYKKYADGDVKTRYSLMNSVTFELDIIDGVLDVLKNVFIYVGLSMAIFASLMLSNFISTSISYKKSEIGILRAIGSRSADVFRIFFSESFIIACINYVLSITGTVLISILINKALRNDYGILITFLSFGVRQVFILLAISLSVAALATFLPVQKNAKKKPIDAIRKR